MTRARRGHRLDGFAFPFDMVIILDEQGNRRTGRFARHHTAQNLHRVLFDLHASARAISLLTAGQFLVDDVWCKGKTRRHAIQDGSQRRSVGFTSSEKA